MNNLNLIIAIDKLKIIFNFAFSQIFKQLKIYLSKIDYFRQYVFYYVQKILSLQQRKTRLLKIFFIKDKLRQQHNRRTSINAFFDVEIDFFDQLQIVFNRSTFLIHFDKTRVLYLNIDVFKNRDWNIMMYHIKRKTNIKLKIIDASFKNFEIKFIMFLNKILSSAKNRYWFIELKIIVFVWLIRKFRQLIVNFEHSMIIFIDHVVNSVIINKIKFTSFSVDKLNFKFVRVFMYLFQFRLKIYHRSDKFNVVIDAFNRLFTIRHNFVDKKIDNFNLNIYHNEVENFSDEESTIKKILIEISSEFRQQLLIDYQKNKNWEFIYDFLINLKKQVTTTTIDDLNKIFNKLIVTNKIIRENFSSISSIEIIFNDFSQIKINKSSFVVIISRRFFITSTVISRRFSTSIVFIDSEIQTSIRKNFSTYLYLNQILLIWRLKLIFN